MFTESLRIDLNIEETSDLKSVFYLFSCVSPVASFFIEGKTSPRRNILKIPAIKKNCQIGRVSGSLVLRRSPSPRKFKSAINAGVAFDRGKRGDKLFFQAMNKVPHVKRSSITI